MPWEICATCCFEMLFKLLCAMTGTCSVVKTNTFRVSSRLQHAQFCKTIISNVISRLATMKDWLELTVNEARYLDVPDVSAKVCEVIKILVPSVLQARDDHEHAKAALVDYDTRHREQQARQARAPRHQRM